MILGGEIMSKIGHGVGRCTVAFSAVCDVALFFCGCSRAKKRAKNPTPSLHQIKGQQQTSFCGAHDDVASSRVVEQQPTP
jgi:hypothetical protein